MGIIKHPENLLVQEWFSPIVHAKMFKPGAVVNNFSEQTKIHEAFFPRHTFCHKTKRATQVAGIGRFDNQ
jgi:hypothetical protein